MVRFNGTVFITSVRVKGGSGEVERVGIMVWGDTGGTVIVWLDNTIRVGAAMGL